MRMVLTYTVYYLKQRLVVDLEREAATEVVHVALREVEASILAVVVAVLHMNTPQSQSLRCRGVPARQVWSVQPAPSQLAFFLSRCSSIM